MQIAEKKRQYSRGSWVARHAGRESIDWWSCGSRVTKYDPLSALVSIYWSSLSDKRRGLYWCVVAMSPCCVIVSGNAVLYRNSYTHQLRHVYQSQTSTKRTMDPERSARNSCNSWPDRRTDRRTDGRTTNDSNTDVISHELTIEVRVIGPK